MGLTIPQESGMGRGSIATAPEGRAAGRGESTLRSCPGSFRRKAEWTPEVFRRCPEGEAQEVPSQHKASLTQYHAKSHNRCFLKPDA